MILSTILTRAALAIALAVSTVSVYSSAAQAYVCKSSATQKLAVKNPRFRARQAARENWTNSVKIDYGLSWSLWKIAQNKTMNCQKKNLVGGAIWVCVATGNPCNYVVQ